MHYSSIGIFAFIVLLIVNQDVIFKAKENEAIPALKYYRLFVFGVLAFCLCDSVWGILDIFHLMTLLYIDTILFFSIMALIVVFWAKYSITYISRNSVTGKLLVIGGNIFLAASLVFLVINLFTPVLFYFNDNNEYITIWGRYLIFGLQIIIFFLTAVYTLATSISKKVENKRRYRTIGYYSLAMAILISIQIYFPLLPLMSAGYMIGTCLLHSFIIEDEKKEYKDRLEKSLKRELAQKNELVSAMHLAYTDILTGLSNKLAYLELVESIEKEIALKKSFKFSIAVLDLNDLKLTNDTYGHERGDHYLIEASALICKYFAGSQVFRIGGDEFAVILEANNYQKRKEIVKDFKALMKQNIDNNIAVLIAIGMADYDENIDTSYQSVFERADKAMYQHKDQLKNMKKSKA